MGGASEVPGIFKLWGERRYHPSGRVQTGMCHAE